jgi:glutathione-regulated potassium-efflux system ancillary protein KefC
VIYTLATLFKMHVADRLLLAILLSQAGEFAFVVRSLPGRRQLQCQEIEMLTVVVASRWQRRRC